MAFSIKLFSGMKPRLSPRLTEPQNGQLVVNGLFISGELDSLKDDSQIGADILLNTGEIKSLYKFGDQSSEELYWFNWTSDVDVVRGAVNDDTTERTYFTGNGVPKMTYFPLAVSGASVYPANSYTLGIPVPDSAVGLTRVQSRITSISYSGTTATAITQVAHNRSVGDTVDIYNAGEPEFNGLHTITSIVNATSFTYEMDSEPSAPVAGAIYYSLGSGGEQSIIYGITYVSAAGEEGKPLVTNIISYAEGDTIELTLLPVAPTGNYNITKKRIYRSVSGSSESSLRFVAEIPVAQTTYDDNTLSSDLLEEIPSLFYDAPPDDMFGLTGFVHGVMAGISGNQVLLCEPYQPHAYPVANRYSFRQLPTALGAFGNSIVVLSKGKPELLTGSDPQNMSQDIIQHGKPCLSSRSVVELEGGVAWACDEGIAFMSSNGFQLLTNGLFTAREWAQYQPSTIRAYRWHDKYVGFYGGTSGFIYDLRSNEFRELDFYVTAGYADPETSELYVAKSDYQLYKFGGGSVNRDVTYKSKVFVEAKPRCMRLAKVIAEVYPVDFTLTANGQAVASVQVESSRVFPLPMGYLATDFEVQVVLPGKLTSITVAESMDAFKLVAE